MDSRSNASRGQSSVVPALTDHVSLSVPFVLPAFVDAEYRSKGDGENMRRLRAQADSGSDAIAT